MATANTSNIQLAHQHFSSENAQNLFNQWFSTNFFMRRHILQPILN